MKFPTALVALGVGLANTACGGGSLGTPTPVQDPDRAVLRVRESNPFPATSQIIFEWDVREPDLRLDGRGITRLQSPDRARLDLFMDNNEAVLAAALLGDRLSAREGTRLEVVPSPAMLWASLGVFRPGAGATLLGAESFEGDVLRLRYRVADGDELRYQFRAGRVTEVELLHDGDAIHSIELSREDGGELPTEAIYRNLASFSELTVTVETVERVDSHPSDIWDVR